MRVSRLKAVTNYYEDDLGGLG